MMKPVKSIIVALLVALAPSLANATLFTYSGAFSGANEASPNASPATGVGAVTFDDATKIMTISANFSGLLGTTSAAHIHCCAAPGVNAGVAVHAPSLAAFPLGVMAGSYSQTFDMTLAGSFNAAFVTNNGGTLTTALAALLAGLNSGNAYFNIHTSSFGGGEIRANLQRVNEIPAPAAIWLFGIGAAALFRARRRVARAS